MSSEYCTKEELAKHLSVSPHTVGGWVRKGLFPAGTILKIGQTYRFKLKEIEEHFTRPPVVVVEAPEPPEEDAPVQLELPFEGPEEVEELEDEIPSFDFDADEDV